MSETSIKIADVLDRDERRALTRKSDVAGALAVFINWMLVFAALGVAARWPHPLVIVLVLLFLGGRQLAFAILTHEAAHRTLFANRWANDVLTDWLCARPMWTDVTRYRRHHMGHHSNTGTDQDPDMSLVRPFPTSPASLRRKLLRDISGASGLRRIVGLLGMDFGILEYSVAGDPKRLPQEGRTVLDYAKQGLPNMAPVILTNVTLYLILASFGIGWTYALWVLAYLGPFSLYLRIRSIAEHACLEDTGDVWRNTRTTRANWLARLTVAPFNVNFHLEHHLMAAVPFYRLPALHAKLREKGLVRTEPGYWSVLKKAAQA